MHRQLRTLCAFVAILGEARRGRTAEAARGGPTGRGDGGPTGPGDHRRRPPEPHRSAGPPADGPLGDQGLARGGRPAGPPGTGPARLDADDARAVRLAGGGTLAAQVGSRSRPASWRKPSSTASSRASPAAAYLVAAKELKVQEQLQGNRYVGIHIQLSYDNKQKQAVIQELVPGGPADRAGGRRGIGSSRSTGPTPRG